MDQINSIFQTCVDKISEGDSRDTIDSYLKAQGYTQDTINKVNDKLQYVYLQEVKNKLDHNEAMSNIVAGYIILGAGLLFTIYTIITGNLISLIIIVIVIYTGNSFLTKGKKLKKEAEGKSNFKKRSKIQKLKKDEV